MANESIQVIAGIDTHADTHHVAVINEHGKPLADREFLAVGSGYRKILDFIPRYGTVTAVGVEGTGSYGAELTKTLRNEGLTVLEVNRPNRAARRLKGKSDPLDAYQAAQSILDGRTTAIPKAKDGPVECLRVLRAARTSAVKARTAAINQIKGLLVTAPDKLRARYRTLGARALITALQRHQAFGTYGRPNLCLPPDTEGPGHALPVPVSRNHRHGRRTPGNPRHLCPDALRPTRRRHGSGQSTARHRRASGSHP